MCNDDTLIEVLERIDKRLARLERLFLEEKNFGGTGYVGCLSRIMYGVE